MNFELNATVQDCVLLEIFFPDTATAALVIARAADAIRSYTFVVKGETLFETKLTVVCSHSVIPNVKSDIKKACQSLPAGSNNTLTFNFS